MTKENFKYYGFVLDSNVLGKLKEIAQRDGRSQKYLVNKILSDYVKANY